MATSRIELDFEGKYSVGGQFKQLDSDLKSAGRAMKDMGQAATSVASEIAGSFGAKINGTLKTSLSLFSEMARGGIWGAMSVAASAAIGFIADKLREAKEQAKELGEALDKHVAEGFRKVRESATTDLADTRKEIADATKDADAMLAALNGKVAESAKAQVARLHVETLQKMTDATSDAAKAALQAQEQFTATVYKSNAAMDAAGNAIAFAQKKQELASDRVAASENALAETRENQDRIERRYESVLMRQAQLKERITEILTLSVNNEEYANANAGRLAGLREKLAELETSNVAVLEQVAQGRKDVAAREADVAAAESELATAARAVTAANAKLETIKAENAAAEADAKAKRDAANDALAKETAAAEAAAKAKEREAQNALVVEKIKAYAVEKDIEYTEYVELATKALEEGYSAETAINLVRARYKSALEEAAKSQEESAAGGTSGKGVAADLKQAIKEGVSAANIVTNVNTGGVGDGVDQSDEVITLGGLQRDVRDEQRKARNRLDSVKQSSAAMQAYLKGQMSPQVAKKFEERMKANGLTMQDFGTMTEKALKAQLLTHSQAVEQQQAILEMKKILEKMGLK